MSIVQAFQCDHTGKLFPLDKKEKYQEHLRKLAYERSKKIIEKRNCDRVSSQIAKIRSSCKSLQDICDAIILNPTLFYENGCIRGRDKKEANWRKFMITSIEMKMTFSPECSNSHGAPFGKPTNWGRNPDLPTGFPGYTGRLNFRFNQETPFFTSRLFEDIGMYCGSGGGSFDMVDGTREYYYGCDFTIWFDDWPGLKSFIQEELNDQIIDRLTDNRRDRKMKMHHVSAYAETEER